MKVRMISDANKIGGCIFSVETDEVKLIFDFGKDLDNDNEIEIEGLTYGEKIYDAVFISHYHKDHIGMINKVLPDIDVYVESECKTISNIMNDFTSNEQLRNTINFNFRDVIKIKDVLITPYIVDHSAYNSSMFLVEFNNRKLLYTGDFRNHGYKGSLFRRTLRLIGKVDFLITEGTNLDKPNRIYSESKLIENSVDLMNKYDNVLLLQSASNFDRITTFYKAAIRSNKTFIMEMYMASLTYGLKSIPNITWNNIYSYIPHRVYRSNNSKYDKYKELVYSKNKLDILFNNNICMNVRTSMIKDIKMLTFKGALDNSCLIYSMYSGYKDNEDMIKFLNEIKELGIDIYSIHTSGHGDVKCFEYLEEICQPTKTLVIHTNSDKVFFRSQINLNKNEFIYV